MNCRICNNKELQPTDTFCPTCGFEIHIMPAGASDAVKEHENERAERYNKTWNALQDSVAEVQKLEIQSKEIQQKLDEKQKELDDKTKNLGNLLSEARHKIAQLETQLKEKQEGASQFQKTIEKLKKQIGDYLDQKKEKEEWKSKYEELSKQTSSMQEELAKQMSSAQLEISQLKSQLQSMTAEKERLENTLKKQNNQPASSNPSDSASTSNQNRGERKGEVVFSDGQHTIKQDIYSGNNVYKTPLPLHTDIIGDLFAIVEDDGEFTVYDRCGSLKKANGRGVGEKGEQIFNGDVLSVGSIQIQVELPDINFDDINF